MNADFDVIVVGSGFGGSVAALRLTEKGYRVAVIEAGQRFSDETLPKTSWRLRQFLWAPQLRLFGLQRIHVLGDVAILAGAGVGGGSLNYANTLYVPPKKFFDDPQWSGITDWADELAPYYDQAARMLGVTENPWMSPADEVMKAVADEMGVGHTFRLTPVGVYFGDGPGVTRTDPYFGGAGPDRTGCTFCGECMTGCRHNAKNTLPKNYLALAEAAGATIIPMSTVTAVAERTRGGFVVRTTPTGAWTLRGSRLLRADHVVIAAGTYGTQRLLHRMRQDGFLPRLSASLGRLTRTNSESLMGAIAPTPELGLHQGVAITSSFYADEQTHIEPVRYGVGSNAMGLLQSLMSRPEPGVPRWRSWLREVGRQPATAAKLFNVHRWSERTIIGLVMQTADNSVTTTGKRTRLGGWTLTTKRDEGRPAPTHIESGAEAMERVAEKIGGIAGGNVFENFDISMTAHFVGGCPIGADAEHGVIDAYHRAWGHPGLSVVDGSAITANLGVNPSLTITAQAERAMAMWPNKGDADPRPTQAEPYRAVAPVAPKQPVVPRSAPGALRQ